MDKRLFILMMLIAFYVGGCATTPRQAEDFGTGIAIYVPDRQILHDEDVPPDVKLVLAALVNKMRGDRDVIPDVRFDLTGYHDVGEEEFRYEGYDLTVVDLTRFDSVLVSNNEARAQMEGVFHFEDIIGRRASTYFAAAYTKTREGVTINKSATTGVAPVFPRIEGYFVPRGAVEQMEKYGIDSFAELYLFAIDHAIAMEPTEAERRDREAYEKMGLWDRIKTGIGGQGDYYLIAFCMDRISSDAVLEMKVTNRPDATGSELAEVLYVIENGWRIMIAGGKFKLDSPQDNFYASVNYVGDPPGGEEPLLVAFFKNEKDYSLRRSAQTPTATPTVPQTPIASGERFLNPSNQADALIIQKRLKELGFYKGTIDGEFGPVSKAALGEFISANGMGDDVRWTPQVQKRLFEGSGLIEKPVPVEEEKRRTEPVEPPEPVSKPKSEALVPKKEASLRPPPEPKPSSPLNDLLIQGAQLLSENKHLKLLEQIQKLSGEERQNINARILECFAHLKKYVVNKDRGSKQPWAQLYESIERSKDRNATPMLLKIVKDQEDYTRLYAVTLLGSIGDHRAIDPLQQIASSDPNRKIRRSAAKSAALILDSGR